MAEPLFPPYKEKQINDPIWGTVNVPDVPRQQPPGASFNEPTIEYNDPIYGLIQIPASAASTLSSLRAAPTDPLPSDPGVTWGDYGAAVMAGGAGFATGVGWLARHAGAENLGGFVEHYGSKAVDYWMDSMTDAARKELSKEFIHKDEEGNYSFGDASLQTVGLLGAQSLLGTAAGAGVGAGFTKVLQAFANPAGRAALTAAVKAGQGTGASIVTQQAARAAAKKLAATDIVLGATGFGLGEGIVAGMSAGETVEREIMAMPHEKLLDLERYQIAYASMEGMGLDELDRRNYAREMTAEDASMQAAWRTMATTGVLGAPMGAFFGKLMGQQANNIMSATRIRNMVTGAGGEAVQEAGQSGIERAISNVETGRPVGEGVLSAAVGGAAAGAPLGGAFGAAVTPSGKQASTQKRDLAKPSTGASGVDAAVVAAQERGAPQAAIDQVLESDVVGIKKIKELAALEAEPEGSSVSDVLAAHEEEGQQLDEELETEAAVDDRPTTVGAWPPLRVSDITEAFTNPDRELTKDTINLDSFTAEEMRQAARDSGLPASGSKTQLRDRLIDQQVRPEPELSTEAAEKPELETDQKIDLSTTRKIDIAFEDSEVEIKAGDLDLKALSRDDLKQVLIHQDLKTTGTKPILAQRIIDNQVRADEPGADMPQQSKQEMLQTLQDFFGGDQVTTLEGISEGLANEGTRVTEDDLKPLSKTQLLMALKRETGEVGKPRDTKADLKTKIVAGQAGAFPEGLQVDPAEEIVVGEDAENIDVEYGGLEVAIENPAGSIREGVDEEGEEFSNQLQNPYGYIKGTRGADGEEVDVFLGAFIGDEPEPEEVFVVDQLTSDGDFDEHKVMYGFKSAEEAEAAYLANYEANWDRYSGVTAMPANEFKVWLREGDLTQPILDVMYSKQDLSASGTGTPAQQQNVHKLRHDAAYRAGRRGKLSDKARGSVISAAEKAGLDPLPFVNQAVQRAKRYPKTQKRGQRVTQRWAQLEEVEAVWVDKKGRPQIRWKKIPYTFHVEPSSGKANKKTQTVRAKKAANKIVAELRNVERLAQQGNKNAQTVMREKQWYTAIRERLRLEFGGAADAAADVLGATSPRTAVGLNFRYTMDILGQMSRGEVTGPLKEFLTHIDAGGTAENYEGPVLLAPNGKRYGTSTKRVLTALGNVWRRIKPGMSPKARNFSMNLIGASDQATIDMWAARTLQRVTGGLRIPPPAEGAVKGLYNAAATSTTGMFGFGQEAFALAGEQMGMHPHEVQALVWFMEKDIWAAEGWTSGQGEGGSFEEQLDLRKFSRYVAGLSIQVGDVTPETRAVKRVARELRRVISKDQSVVSLRSASSIGLYAGDEEVAYDLEVTAGPDFNVNRMIRSVTKVAREHSQFDTFVSRVIGPDEVNENARPGLEIYFTAGATRETMQPVIDAITELGIDGFTFIVDPRTEVAGRVGEYAGVRLQYAPEFSARWDEDFRSQMEAPGALNQAYEETNKVFNTLQNTVQQMPDVVASLRVNYDTVIIGQEYYDEVLAAKPGRPNSRAKENWFPSSRSESYARAVAGYRGLAGAGSEGNVPNGVARTEVLSSRLVQPRGAQHPVRRGKRHSDRIRESLQKAIDEVSPYARVTVVHRAQDLPFRIPKRAHLTSEAIYVTRGEYAGQVFLIGRNLTSVGRAQEVFMHEVFGHAAMEDIPEFADILAAVESQVEVNAPDFAQYVARVNASQPGLDTQTQAKEVIAQMAESGVDHPLIKRAIANVRAMMRRAGFKVRMSQNDVRALIAKAARRYGHNETRAPETPFATTMELELAYSRAIAGVAELSEEQLQKIIDSGGRDEATTYVGRISPETFIKLTTAEQNDEDDLVISVERNGATFFDTGAFQESYSPYLWIKDGVVAAHDGRHRATRARIAGETSIPVVLHIEGALPDTLKPQDFGGMQRQNYVAPTPSLVVEATQENLPAMRALVGPASGVGVTVDHTPAEKRWWKDIVHSPADMAELVEEVPSAYIDPDGSLQIHPRDLNALSEYLDTTRSRDSASSIPPRVRDDRYLKMFVERAYLLSERAYHGSPHTFKKFDLHAIGTGEGVHAYGWGLYFTSKKEIAEHYRDNLSNDIILDGKVLDSVGGTMESNAAIMIDRHSPRTASGQPDYETGQKIAVAGARVRAEQQPSGKYKDQDLEFADYMEKFDASRLSAGGKVYTAEIPDQSDMLDWDKPLNEQPEGVRTAIKSLDVPSWGMTGKNFYDHVGRKYGGMESALWDKEASAKLKESGIPGITYIGSESGERNFVVFGDKQINITGVNGEEAAYLSSERFATTAGSEENATSETRSDIEAPVRRDERISSPPIQQGRIQLKHWSRGAGLKTLDPSWYGKGISGAEARRKLNDSADWVDRTYYGVAVGQNGGYVKEDRLGPHEYDASVDADSLYDLARDPEGFLSKARETERGNSALTLAERLVRDAGYDGYWVAHPQLGMTAAVFTTLDTELLQSSTPIDFAERAKQRDLNKATGEFNDSVSARIEERLALMDDMEFKYEPGDMVLGSTGRPLKILGGTVDERSGVPLPAYFIEDSEGGRFTMPEWGITEKMTGPMGTVVPSAPDMSVEGRHKRAQAQGFDTSRTLYHGTVTDFEAFREGRGPTRTSGGEMYNGEIHFFTTSPKVASGYARPRDTYGYNEDTESFERSHEGQVIPVFARLENPLVINAEGKNWQYFLTEIEGARFKGGMGAVSKAIKAGAVPVSERLERGEYDGVIIKNVQDDFISDEHAGGIATTVVVFDPANVRSVNAAFLDENIGENNLLYSKRARMSPEYEAIASDVMDVPNEDLTWRDRMDRLKQRWNLWDKGSLRQGMIDGGYSVERMERDFTGGGLLDAMDSAYKAYVATKNLPSVMAAVHKFGVPEDKDGAFQVVEGREGLEFFNDLKDGEGNSLLYAWEVYAAARRADRLLKETNPDGTARENNFTQEDVDAILVEGSQVLDANGEPLFERVSDQWQAFNDQLLDLAVETGAMNEEMRETWRTNDYVPMFRAMDMVQSDTFTGTDEGRTGGVGGKTISGKKVTSMRLTGSDKKIQGQVFENMMMNTAHILDTMFKHVAMERVIALGEGTVMHKVPYAAKASRFTGNQLARAMVEAGLIVAPPSEPDPIGFAHGVVNRMNKAQKEHWVTLFSRVAPVGRNLVSVMEGGKMAYYEVTDPLLFRSINAMGTQNFEQLMWKIFRGPKHLLTAMVTADPAFMLANFARDTLSSWVVSDAKLLPMTDAVKGFSDALSQDPLLFQIMMAGGGGGGFYTQDRRDLRALIASKKPDGGTDSFMRSIVKLDSSNSLWSAWQRVGEASENANRLAVARRVLEAGGSMAEAAYQAQDLLNFSMRGDFAAVQVLIETVPFMNARIQGIYRLYRGARDNPVGFALKGATIMAASMALLASNWDDPRYQNLEEWDRDTYWHSWIGGQHTRIPKPFEVGAIFATVPERLMQTMLGDEDLGLFARRMGAMITDTFAMNPTPQALRPFIEQFFNTDMFTGNPLVGMALDGKVPEAQYNAYTSETMRELADGMPGWAPEWLRSPKRLEAFVEGFFSSMGMYAVSAVDGLTRGVAGYPDQPELKIWDMPVAKRFIRDPVPFSNKWQQSLYEWSNEANQIASGVKAYRQEKEIEKAEELREKHLPKLQARKALNRIRRMIAKINNQMRLVSLSHEFNSSQKWEKVQALKQKKLDLLGKVEKYAGVF